MIVNRALKRTSKLPASSTRFAPRDGPIVGAGDSADGVAFECRPQSKFALAWCARRSTSWSTQGPRYRLGKPQPLRALTKATSVIAELARSRAVRGRPARDRASPREGRSRRPLTF